MSKIILIIIVIVIASCSERNKDSGFAFHKPYRSKDMRSGLRLFEDSTFILWHKPSNQYVFKEVGSFNINDRRLKLKRGVDLEEVAIIQYTTGSSDSLLIRFTSIDSVQKFKVILFDSIMIESINSSIVINKRQYFDRLNIQSSWEEYDNTFVVDLKVKVGVCFISLFRFNPTKSIEINFSNAIPETAPIKFMELEIRDKDLIVTKNINPKLNLDSLYL